MDYILEDVKGALRAGLYNLALTGTLAAIDMCAALENETGRTNGERFRSWADQNLGNTFPLLDSQDLWDIRCGLVHQGRINAGNYDAIVFTLPNEDGNTFHNNILNDALNLDLAIFCNSVIEKIESWWDENAEDENVKRNAEHLVRLRHDGLAPYIVGTPVLA